MNNCSGGGGMSASSLTVLEEMHDVMRRRLPLVSTDDPLHDQLVQLERTLRRCRRRADDQPRRRGPGQAAEAAQPVS